MCFSLFLTSLPLQVVVLLHCFGCWVKSHPYRRWVKSHVLLHCFGCWAKSHILLLCFGCWVKSLPYRRACSLVSGWDLTQHRCHKQSGWDLAQDLIMRVQHGRCCRCYLFFWLLLDAIATWNGGAATLRYFLHLSLTETKHNLIHKLRSRCGSHPCKRT